MGGLLFSNPGEASANSLWGDEAFGDSWKKDDGLYGVLGDSDNELQANKQGASTFISRTVRTVTDAPVDVQNGTYIDWTVTFNSMRESWARPLLAVWMPAGTTLVNDEIQRYEAEETSKEYHLDDDGKPLTVASWWQGRNDRWTYDVDQPENKARFDEYIRNTINDPEVNEWFDAGKFGRVFIDQEGTTDAHAYQWKFSTKLDEGVNLEDITLLAHISNWNHRYPRVTVVGPHDTDGDDFPDWVERRAGTDKNDLDSHPQTVFPAARVASVHDAFAPDENVGLKFLDDGHTFAYYYPIASNDDGSTIPFTTNDILNILKANKNNRELHGDEKAKAEQSQDGYSLENQINYKLNGQTVDILDVTYPNKDQYWGGATINIVGSNKDADGVKDKEKYKQITPSITLPGKTGEVTSSNPKQIDGRVGEPQYVTDYQGTGESEDTIAKYLVWITNQSVSAQNPDESAAEAVLYVIPVDVTKPVIDADATRKAAGKEENQTVTTVAEAEELVDAFSSDKVSASDNFSASNTLQKSVVIKNAAGAQVQKNALFEGETYTLVATVQDQAGNVAESTIATFAIEGTPNTAPEITVPQSSRESAITIYRGETNVISGVSVSDAEDDDIALSSDNLTNSVNTTNPNGKKLGVVYNADDQQIEITPTLDATIGDYTISIGSTIDGSAQVVDSQGMPAARKDVYINVVEQNAKYTPAGPATSPSVMAGGTGTIAAPTFDDVTTPDTVEANAAPANATFAKGSGDNVPDWATVNENGTISVAPGADVDPGEYIVPVAVTYPDGSTDTVEVPVTVKVGPVFGDIQNHYVWAGTELTVPITIPVTDEDGTITDVSLRNHNNTNQELNTGLNVALADSGDAIVLSGKTQDLTKTDFWSGKARATDNDNNVTHSEKFRIIALFTGQPQKATVTTASDETTVKNALIAQAQAAVSLDASKTEQPGGEFPQSSLPADQISYEVVGDLPDITTAGDKQTVQVKATLPNGNEKIINVPLEVVATNADTYTPKAAPVNAPYGTPVSADTVTAAVSTDYPADAQDQPTVAVKEDQNLPDGQTPGKHDITVVVTYPDGTSEDVTVPVTVAQKPETPTEDPDTDGDGFTDKEEKEAGSNPDDPASTPDTVDGGSESSSDGTKNDGSVAPSVVDGLPRTGGQVAGFAGLAGLLSAAGAGLLALRRRRKA